MPDTVKLKMDAIVPRRFRQHLRDVAVKEDIPFNALFYEGVDRALLARGYPGMASLAPAIVVRLAAKNPYFAEQLAQATAAVEASGEATGGQRDSLSLSDDDRAFLVAEYGSVEDGIAKLAKVARAMRALDDEK